LFNATEKDLYSFTSIVVILQTASFAINVWIHQSTKQGACMVYPTPTGCGLTWWKWRFINKLISDSSCQIMGRFNNRDRSDYTYNVWLGTERPGFDPRKRQRICLLASVSRPVLGPTQPPVQWVPGVKRGA
jgi:hypothetical protein